jgi:hypothetical protein
MWRINYAFVPGSERVPFLGAGRLARRRARRASSRKYSEMRLADLSGAGDAIRELKLGIEQKCACGALYGATWGSIVSAPPALLAARRDSAPGSMAIFH